MARDFAAGELETIHDGVDRGESAEDLIRELTDWMLAVEIGPGQGREPELERQHLQWRRIDLANRADRFLGRAVAED